MKVVETIQDKRRYLVLSGARLEGLSILDLDTKKVLQNIISDHEDFMRMSFIKNQNLLISGSSTGNLRLIDINNLDKLKERGDEAIQKLTQVDSCIRIIETSPDEDQQFVVVGTSKGFIHVYKTENIE